jgi:beta-lactamase class A
MINGFYYRGFTFYTDYLSMLEWNEVYDEFESLPGDNALLIVKDNDFSYAFNTGSRLKVASSFKLFVLKALSENITNTVGGSWNTQIPIRDQWKSGPSGILHTKPEGTLYTLKQLADYMINISDNTATDHSLIIYAETMLNPFCP